MNYRELYGLIRIRGGSIVKFDEYMYRLFIWRCDKYDQLVNSYVLCYFSYSSKLLPLVVRRPLSV